MVFLEFDHVSRTYDGGVPVRALRSASLQIEEGDFLSIAGASGSGKSTMLNLLGLLDRPSGGTYKVAGLDTTSLTERARAGLRARFFGFVFQSFHLLADRTALENVEMGMLYLGTRRRVRRLVARRMLTEVGLSHRADALPSTLSGGERQRTAIARALVARPPILLCDEPTGNLDQKSANTVLDLLESLNGAGLTVVIVTHDREISKRAHRNLNVSDGFVTE